MTTITPESKRIATGVPPRAPRTMRPLGAVALLLGLAWGQAHALSLGRLSVQSALGEPLRAEIAVPDITPDEAASLKATLASPEAFKAAGIEYNNNLANIRVVFEQRGNGRAALVLTSTRPFTEPFLDLILEANWANGKIARDYTLLLDPPSLTATAPAPVTEAVVPAPAGAPPQTSTRQPAAKPPVQPRPARVPSAPPKAAAPVPVTAPTSTEGSGATQQVVVKPGDTAGRIAAATKPVGISLDQMLLALLSSNPQAFLERNVNRLRAGAVLNVPTADQAAVTPPEQATQAIVAQSRDFNAFRAKLAANVPATPTAKPTRQAAGKVEARVEDKQAAAATPDKLQLSKGGVSAVGKVSPEETLAQARENQAAAARAAELSKNLDDLTKLTGKAPAGANPATAAASSASSAPVPGVPIAVGNSGASAAAPASSPSSVPVTAASGPSAAASAKAAPTPAQAPVPAAAEEGFFEGSGFLLGLGALLALLLGLALFRARQRKNDDRPSAFMDSLVQADPMYGSSGGQRVDTRGKDSGDSTMGFSPSQLDAASDVDPVVEAEVYLAYGRDVQAEEILKEALRTHPTRVSIHVKLAEIYAKRRDSTAFEAAVAQVATLTHSTGPDWAHVQTLSQQLDPSNVLSQATTPVPEPVTAVDTPAPAEPVATPLPTPTPAPSPTMTAPENLPPLDLDMDFAPGADLHTPVATAAPAPMFTASATAPPAALDMLDFKLDQLDMAPSTDSATAMSGVSPERLEVKLELASEFMAIGDDEGARALVQEVLAEATGDLKARAQKLLTSLR